MREWLNNWSSIGLIIGGMTHQGWDVQLTAYAARDWRANFIPVGIARLAGRHNYPASILILRPSATVQRAARPS